MSPPHPHTPILLIALLLTACNEPQVQSPPTATLRPMPSATPSPVYPTLAFAESPTAIPTLTPTPTPILYTVQSGDTLIGIAVRHDVSLEAIEAANLGIDPGNLQPGQTLIIPPPETDAASPILPYPHTPLPLTVGAFNCYPTPSASTICLSEFTNTTSEPIVNLAVQVTLLNPNNEPIATALAYSPLDLIPPGTAVPLAAVFTGANGRAAVASVVAAESGAALADRFAMLTIGGASGSADAAGFTISGSLINQTAGEIQSISIAATVYNSVNRVTGYRALRLAQMLPPNGSAPFSISFPGIDEAAKWTVIAQGRTK